MLRNVFTKSLRDQRWSLLGWSIGLLLLLLAESSVWPTLRDMPKLDELLQGYPEAMKDLFDIEAMATATGFMNAELFTLVLPLLFIIFGVSRGARMVAGEEEGGTLEVLLVTRVSTTALMVQKAAALVVSVATLGLVLFVGMVMFAPIFDMDIGASDVATGSLAMVLLGIEFGSLALAVGAATGSRALAIGVAGSVALASYVLYALGLFVDSFKAWQPVSPFQQALSEGPLGAGLPPSFGWMLLGAATFLAVGVPVFGRRDIRTA